MGNIKCTACGKHHGYCSEVAAQLTPTGATDRDSDLTNPGQPYRSWWDEQTKENIMDLRQHYDKDTNKGGGKFKRRPFLKAKDIAAKGSLVKILDFREAPKAMEYSDFLCDVSIGKKEFTWGLRSKSVTLNQLIEKLGKRTEKWIGKTVKLMTAGPKGQYVNVAG
jgi:hypothetical protein